MSRQQLPQSGVLGIGRRAGNRRRGLGRAALGSVVVALLVTAVVGCTITAGDESSPAPTASAPTEPPPVATATANPSPSASSAAPAAPAKVGGELTTNAPFIGFVNKNVKIAGALAYLRDDGIQIELASDTIGPIECGHNWGLGREIGAGQLGVELRSRGISYSAPVKQAVGTYQHLGYTYYYRRAGFDQGTNSGNSAREDLDTELEITALTDTTLSGRLRIRDEVQGTFAATICR